MDLHSCSCGKIPSTDEYDYVAFVEIYGVLKSNLYELGNSNKLPEPIFHEIKIKTINQYIGRKQEFIIVHGGNNKYNVGLTSCDMNMEIGEKWIIYGKKFKSKISTNYCSLSILHSNTKLEIDYKYNRSTNRLKELNKRFNSNKINKPNSSILLTYTNGKKQLKEKYNEKSKLIGDRQAFYSNGQLMVDEHYSNGLKNGTLTWFYRDGKVHRSSTFKNGKEICESYYYDYTGRLNRINYFDDDGKYKTTEKKAR